MIHVCHNPNCDLPLPASLVAHKRAWFALPKSLRDEILKHYRRGQENDKRASQEYRAALRDCIRFWMSEGTRCMEK